MAVAWMTLAALVAGNAARVGAQGITLDPQRLAGVRTQVDRASVAAAPAPDAAVPPPCSGDVCQPRVAVPGYEPRVSTKGKRTELAAQLLDRSRIEPLASVSHFLVVTGLRLDYTPGPLESPTSGAHDGWGHVLLSLRWRIDAAGRPVWVAPR